LNQRRPYPAYQIAKSVHGRQHSHGSTPMSAASVAGMSHSPPPIVDFPLAHGSYQSPFCLLTKSLPRGCPLCDCKGIASERHVAERFPAQFGRAAGLKAGSLPQNTGTGSVKMEDVKIETAKEFTKTGKSSAESVALHLCYRKIGISAVAAAARYQGSAKNQAYAPVATGTDPSDPAAA
jgi:hypothetical protein